VREVKNRRIPKKAEEHQRKGNNPRKDLRSTIHLSCGRGESSKPADEEKFPQEKGGGVREREGGGRHSGKKIKGI